MPKVGKKHYPYTKAGKAAAKKAKGRLKAARDAGLQKARTAETKKAALKRELDNRGLKRAGRAVQKAKKPAFKVIPKVTHKYAPKGAVSKKPVGRKGKKKKTPSKLHR